jgi:phage FluMu gp28-like protein
MRDFATNRLQYAAALGASFKYQQDIIACTDKYRTVRKCRQAGMTTAFAIEALLDALTYDDYVVCIVSPTGRQSERLMRYIKKAFRKLEKLRGSPIPTEKWTSDEIFFHWGSEIYSLPNNPKGIQGIDCNAAIVDEAGLFTTTEGEAVMDALVGSLGAKARFPASGKITVSGRPRGKRGLLWQYWDPMNPKYKEFTHFIIKWQDRGREDKYYAREVAKHKKILPKLQFDETYNAEFVDEGVLMYPHELLEGSEQLWRARNFVEMSAEGQPQDDKARYIGIDFGKKRSLTEIHVLQREKDRLLRTFMMKSLDRVNFEEQKSFIDGLIKRVKPRQVKIDERGMGLPLLDYFTRQHGVVVQPLKLSQQTKEKVIIQLQNAFMDLRLAIPHKDDLYDQLHSFQKDLTDTGKLVYSGKVDETDYLDDKVIALAAAVDAAESTPFGFIV